MIIAFRTDSSNYIGTGHVMRCLCLADVLLERGATCIFITKQTPGNLIDAIRACGHEVVELPTTTSMRIENDTIDAALSINGLLGKKVDWIVVDHYELGSDWETIMAPYCKKILVIDDLINRPHACDLLLNQNHGCDPHSYADLVPSHCQVLAGANYALLRPQFSANRTTRLNRTAASRIKRIVVTMGGVDIGNASSKILKALAQCDLDADCKVSVVLRSASPWQAEVELLATAMSYQTDILYNVTDMAGLMAGCDLAITAAGTTLWEMCCLGTPMIAVITADNQLHSAMALQASGGLLLIDNPSLIADELPMRVEQCQQQSLRQSLSTAASAVTDGYGTHRVAEALGALVIEPCTIRAMTPSDLETVLTWRNHPDTRQHMRTRHAIDRHEHESWFVRSSQDPAQRLLIVEENGIPFGFVRLSNVAQGSSAEWGFYVAPGMPTGSGKKLGKAALDFAFDSLAISQMMGTVFPENTRSIQFHKSLGFAQQHHHESNAEGTLCFVMPAAFWRYGKTS